jgi:hypothetical protein
MQAAVAGCALTGPGVGTGHRVFSFLFLFQQIESHIAFDFSAEMSF